jgi:hypothetical protein
MIFMNAKGEKAMTETVNNFWQSFPTISLFGASFAEKKEVNDLIGEARKIAASADEEARHAATAQAALMSAEAENLRQNLTIIAVWHLERAARKYREVAAIFAKVENFRVKENTREHFNRQAREAVGRAAENEAAAESLKSPNRELFQN